MDDDVFEALMQNLSTVDAVHFTGAGEPLTDKLISKRMAAIQSAGKEVWVTTNAHLIDGRLLELMSEGGRFYLFISLESLDPATYRKTMVNSDLKAVLANLEKLSKVVARNNRLTVNLGMVGQIENIQGLPEYVRYAMGSGFHIVTVQALLGDSRYQLKNTLFQCPEMLVEYFHQAKRIVDPSDMILNCYYPYQIILDEYTAGKTVTEIRKKYYPYPGKLSNEGLPVGMSRKCLFPWGYFTLNRFGDLFLCCHSAGYISTWCDTMPPIGNLRDTDLADIWNGPFMVALRERFLAGDLPEPCRSCWVVPSCTTETLKKMVDVKIGSHARPEFNAATLISTDENQK